VFETIRKYPERKRLRSGPRIPGVVTVGEHAWQLGHFGNPPAIFFLLEFHAKRNHTMIVIRDVV